MKKKYSTIVFDLGNVLIPFDYSRLVNNLNNIKENLGERFYKKYLDNYSVHRKFETWELSNDEFLDIMINWCENEVDAEKFSVLYSDLFTVNENVVELLPKLKKNYKLVLLSNTNDVHKKYGWEKYSFLEHFDKLILSHEIGAAKPDKEIYQAVENFTGLPSDEHIFIDDVREYGLGAEKLGWDSIHFTGYESLINSFEEKNIIFK